MLRGRFIMGYEGIVFFLFIFNCCMGVRIFFGLGMVWIGYRGLIILLFEVGVLLKKFGVSKGIDGGVDLFIWCIVGCFFIIIGLDDGGVTFIWRWLLSCSGGGWLLLVLRDIFFEIKILKYYLINVCCKKMYYMRNVIG